MRKWVSVAAMFTGLLLVLAAGIVRWVVAPNVAVLPSDTDTTRTYTGTATTLLNANALTSSADGPALLHQVPVTLSHRTRVLDTRGDDALVADSGTIVAAGSPVGGFHYRYAVDRTEMGRGSGFGGVVAQSGITFNFPIRTAAHDYSGWVPDTRSTVQLTYERTARHGGLETYVFHTVGKPALITDPQTLQALPAALPKALVTRLAGSLHLSAAQQAAMSQLLPSLPDPVPFSYTFRTAATYWVEPATGEIVDLREHDVRTLALKVGTLPIPVTPVLDVTYTSSPAQLAAAVEQARHDAGQVNLVYRTLPLIALLAGLAFLVVAVTGLVMLRREPIRRLGKADRRPVDPPSATEGRHRATVINARKPSATPRGVDSSELAQPM